MSLKEVKKVSIKEQARLEVIRELNEKAVKTYKSKLKELQSAKLVVRNIERELEDLEEELSQQTETFDA